MCGLSFLVLCFDVAVIFAPIPQGGQKYADILVGSLNTGAFMSGVNYLLGGNPDKRKADQVLTGDNNKIDNKTIS